VDTAALYGNEAGVGRAVRSSGLSRAEIFVTTKLSNADQRSGRIRDGFLTSYRELDIGAIDLYLIHWPVSGQSLAAWRELEQLQADGLVRAIGVSNFHEGHLRQLLSVAHIPPAINQIEFHPYLQQPGLVDFCEQQGIRVQAWAPLMKGHVQEVKELVAIGQRHGKSAAQVALRWMLQRGLSTIPKSSKRERIASNADLFDFHLSAGEMAAIKALDRSQRIGPTPDRSSL
jgi:diketogulonate reductase-like aldo/keto reductase